jgi:hypothetical protein
METATINKVHESYIEKLPVGRAPVALEAVAVEAVQAVDIEKLPNALVTGSNLIQFPETVSPELKSSVALSLLAAQRVAANDVVVQTPDQWLQRHNAVLENLNWLNEGGGFVNSQFSSINVAVHEAILPFLTAAFGPAAAAGALILTALKQLHEMDKSSPWIALFDQQSRRFNITEYQFSVVQVTGNRVQVRLAAARFDASYGQTQVLFFKIKQEHAAFQSASGTYSTQADLLTEMNTALKAKLASFTASFIASLPDKLLS